MVTCMDVNNLKLDGMELVAGEKGLRRMVSWTYLVQTRPFEEHMNRGNFALIVVDYIRFDFKEVRKAIDELNDLGISGLAICRASCRIRPIARCRRLRPPNG